MGQRIGELFLDALRIAGFQAVLVNETAVRPNRRVITAGKGAKFDEELIAQFGRCLRPEDRFG